jgi:hypothetical protein
MNIELTREKVLVSQQSANAFYSELWQATPDQEKLPELFMEFLKNLEAVAAEVIPEDMEPARLETEAAAPAPAEVAAPKRPIVPRDPPLSPALDRSKH